MLKIHLTLKTPRKPAPENVVCLCRLLYILAKFSNLIWVHTVCRNDKADDNCCDWQFKD